MDVSGPKLPLSAVYLNLLQTRPVSPVSPVARSAAPVAAGASARATDSASSSSSAGGNPTRTIPRGRLIDIVA
jgi:hypothetical protein